MNGMEYVAVGGCTGLSVLILIPGDVYKRPQYSLLAFRMLFVKKHDVTLLQLKRQTL
jgi:hypothetical protein